MASSPRILVIDDEADLRELFEITLIRMGLDVDSAGSVSKAREHLENNRYDLVITDMRLPDGNGLELVEEVTQKYNQTPIAVITAFGSADNAVTALKAGAFDYISKPVELHQLRTMVHSALQLNAVNVSNVADKSTTKKASNKPPTSQLIGKSSAMQHLHAQILRLSRSMAPISITGESGSGKELAAREIHINSPRADKAFIAVNCGAIPDTLMEAEFFGYRKGAFTGANEDRDGFFQAANGGTLLLDEVADLPLAMQVKLLRVIQERSVRKLGDNTEEPIDVRIISATHQDLAECVAQGKFRQDLFYRLNVINLALPPLRSRRDDIALLAEAILARISHQHSLHASLSAQALETLCAYDFPGNVRELENILERALAFSSNGLIQAEDLGIQTTNKLKKQDETTDSETGTAPATPEFALNLPDLSEGLPIPLPTFLDDIERELISRALAQTGNNRTQAAHLLGITFRQLRYQIQRLNIHAPET